ncbi:hypothetical protein OS121_20970 [Mycolicibacterium mucogenicum]|uniref:hypothetical protein n=1 Tax=Mycolicibacterium mucogenicum TaxID=56689 RepID=UPI00226A867D|nr:hypothetical protein [Mycolicibacterium mucogenicum]MCX8557525.1 hypothetical protein [Mycolicibacterium mucogenicum]
MMILDRLQQIEARAQVARDDGSLRQDLIKLGRITQRIATMKQSLQKLATSLDELASVKQPACAAALPVLHGVHTALTQMVELNKVQQLGGATTEFAEKIGDVEQAVKKAEGILGVAWAGYRNERRQSVVDRELLELLNRSGIEVGDLLENYDKASFELELLGDRHLPLQGDVARWQANLDELQRVADGLTEVVPATIAAFFRQTDSPTGAPLSALTEEVRTFLDEHNITDRYSIRGRR